MPLNTGSKQAHKNDSSSQTRTVQSNQFISKSKYSTTAQHINMKFARSIHVSLVVTSIVVSSTVAEAADESNRSPANFIRRIGQLFNSPPGKNLIVILKDDRRLSTDTSRRTIAEIALNRRNEAAEIAHSLNVVPEYTYGAATYGFSTRAVTAEKMAEIENDPRVEYVEIDQTIQLEPIEMIPEEGNRFLRGRQLKPGDNPGRGGGGGDQPAQDNNLWGINRVNGGAIYSGEHKAWILDTGIDLYHSDLNVDSSLGFNAFRSGKDGRSLDDGNGHGTHVAGTVAAKNNEIGVIGVAAGATVVPVKVLDSRGSGSYSGVIPGVDHVAENGDPGNVENGIPGDVANMSLGGGFSKAMNDAVEAAAAAGIKFALAAGNSAADAKNYSPASAGCTDTSGDDDPPPRCNIYTISAMDVNDNFAYFSNFGNPPVDYCAPGVSIKSTWKDGGYNTISGTSMATPHVAGLLLLGNTKTDGTVNDDPDSTPDEIIVLDV